MQKGFPVFDGQKELFSLVPPLSTHNLRSSYRHILYVPAPANGMPEGRDFHRDELFELVGKKAEVFNYETHCEHGCGRMQVADIEDECVAKKCTIFQCLSCGSIKKIEFQCHEDNVMFADTVSIDCDGFIGELVLLQVGIYS